MIFNLLGGYRFPDWNRTYREFEAVEPGNHVLFDTENFESHVDDY